MAFKTKLDTVVETILKHHIKKYATGKTNHAEVVKIEFDDKVITYEQILDFFEIHDPTTLNQQGYDIGTQYRSEIFYTNENQKNCSKSFNRTIINITEK